ncbi:MAG: EamA family transporter [Proteobacteria bacterium]|nr:EamA family transporter [Pseudomonadota bacterium]
MTIMGLTSAAVALPAAALLPLPPDGAWRYLLVSAALQTAYALLLVETYRHGELSQVYPIVRGAAPLLVALGGYLLGGQQLGTRSLTGVALVGGGILCLSTGRARAPRAGVLLALATSAFIAGYTTTDALGVRRAGGAAAYATWMFVAQGLMMLTAYLAARGRLTLDPRAPDTRRALGGGLLSALAYGAVLFAFTLAPAAPVAALRETSVVFAVLIGWLFLRERLTWRRVLACTIVAVGAMLL